jgi:hypothetical protein
MLKRSYLKYLPLVIAAAGIATLIGTRSFADSHAMGPDGGHGRWGHWMFQEMDANKDGKVTQAEIDAFEAARAAEIDADHDGKITPTRSRRSARRSGPSARPSGSRAWTPTATAA